MTKQPAEEFWRTILTYRCTYTNTYTPYCFMLSNTLGLLEEKAQAQTSGISMALIQWHLTCFFPGKGTSVVSGILSHHEEELWSMLDPSR